jgi:hypothetical protein
MAHETTSPGRPEAVKRTGHGCAHSLRPELHRTEAGRAGCRAPPTSQGIPPELHAPAAGARLGVRGGATRLRRGKRNPGGLPAPIVPKHAPVRETRRLVAAMRRQVQPTTVLVRPTSVLSRPTSVLVRPTTVLVRRTSVPSRPTTVLSRSMTHLSRSLRSMCHSVPLGVMLLGRTMQGKTVHAVAAQLRATGSRSTRKSGRGVAMGACMQRLCNQRTGAPAGTRGTWRNVVPPTSKPASTMRLRPAMRARPSGHGWGLSRSASAAVTLNRVRTR